MKDLVYKELKLALHPAAIIFLCLSSMLMIPSYPYFIIFFYTCLGVFFICMSGRENKDIYFTMLLPVQKREIVGARFLLVALIELLQFAAAVPFAFLHNAAYPGPVSYTHLDVYKRQRLYTCRATIEYNKGREARNGPVCKA